MVRIDLSRLSAVGAPEITDVTIACIGECNEKFTGVRDGKTLHKFLSSGLLKAAGVKVENGFFTRYERYLRSVRPDLSLCGEENGKPAADSTGAENGQKAAAETPVW